MNGPEREKDDAAPLDRSPAKSSASLMERLRGLFGLGAASIRDDIEDALEEADGDAGFTAQERTLLKNVLGLHELRVRDVMVPRADIVAAPLDATLGEALAILHEAGHSRLPVIGETLDDPRGMLHIRDFVHLLALAAAPKADAEKTEAPTCLSVDLAASLEAANILRPLLYAPPSMPALDLLVKMQATRTHMALVIDEYGGTDGLVTIEDIVEMIVGDIEDEHDLDESPQFESVAPGVFLADARVGLEEAEEKTGLALAAFGEQEEVDTLGGLAAAFAGRVPIRGEVVASPDHSFEFDIVDADPRRIKRLKLRLIDAEAAAARVEAKEPTE